MIHTEMVGMVHILTINGVDYIESGASATACALMLKHDNTVAWTAGAWDSETSWTQQTFQGKCWWIRCRNIMMLQIL